MPKLHGRGKMQKAEVLEAIDGPVTHSDVSPVTSVRENIVFLPVGAGSLDVVYRPSSQLLPKPTVEPPYPQVIGHSETVSGTPKLAEGFEKLAAWNTDSVSP
jgi:hypothetical protein